VRDAVQFHVAVGDMHATTAAPAETCRVGGPRERRVGDGVGLDLVGTGGLFLRL
jgi:hypothetical protein